MTHYDRPTSLLRCGQFRVLTYEASAFIPQSSDCGGSTLHREGDKTSCSSSLVLGILAATFILTVLLLGTAAAQADPANVGNQATLIRFSNGISFGAVPRTQTPEDAPLALTRLTTFINRNSAARYSRRTAASKPAYAAWRLH